MRWVVIPLAALPVATGVARADAAGPSGRVIDCYCTDTVGARVEVGQEICLFVDGRAYTARCEMSLNVPMWRDTGRACVGALLGLEGGEPAPGAGGVDPQI